MLGQNLPRIGEIDGVPGGEVEEDAGGHLARAVQLAAITQVRHDAGEAELPVEVGAADVYAAIGEEIVAPVVLARTRWREANERKVGGAAADVGNENKFFARQAGFVVKGRRNGLELEAHVRKTDRVGDLGQRRFCRLVSLRVAVNKIDRAAHHDLRERVLAVLVGAAFQFADELREQVAKEKRATVDFGFAFDQAAAEQAFQRTHQPAFVARQIVGETGTAKASAFVFSVEKDHRGQCHLAVFERQQGWVLRPQAADRRV